MTGNQRHHSIVTLSGGADPAAAAYRIFDLQIEAVGAALSAPGSAAAVRQPSAMTLDQERWAEALAIERIHGDTAIDWVVEQIADLAAAGDDAGVRRFREIVERLDQLARRPPAS